MATVMTETTTAKVREEQVTGLTAENAHRVTMIREKGTDHPVSYTHLTLPTKLEV